ncbi:MAG: helix-hairpin-helix domain-containing protein, partial [Hungatella sp.]
IENTSGSVQRPDDLRLAILSGDSKAIARAPGVGPKTAQRVILDLKDRIHLDDVLTGIAEGANPPVGEGSAGSVGKEAIEALVSLGYSGMEASKAVRKITITEDMTAEDVLKASLKHLTF